MVENNKKELLMAIRNLHISFPDKTLFKGVNLDVYEDDFIVITTGVMDGATTFIKSLLGLVDETEGEIIFQGNDLLRLASHSKRQKARKNIGLVYEAGGLISMTGVYENIALPLAYHTSLSEKEIQQKIESIAEDLQITDLLELEPNELNDTQTRIVNLARALIIEPRILLIDELEGGMSKKMVDHMIDVIMAYQKQFHFGIIMTTLDRTIDFGTAHYKIKDYNLFEVT